MIGFGKKKDERPVAPAGGLGVPTQKVMAFSSQGMSEPEIVRRLREEGHSPLEVDRAMKDAMRAGAGMQRPAAPQPAPPRPQQQPLQTVPPAPAPEPDEPPMPTFGPPGRFAPASWGDDEDLGDDFDTEKMEGFPAEKKMGPGAFMDENLPPMREEPDFPEPLPFAQAPLPKERDDRIRELKDRRRKEIEELTEEITEEKWKDLMSRVQLLEENLEKMSGDMKNAAAQARGGSPDDLNPIREELANHKESIEEVNARIDSLEDVVKSSLSPMLESVRKFNKMSKMTNLQSTPSATPHQERPQHAKQEDKEPEVEYEDLGEEEPEPSEAPRYSPKAARK